MGILKPNLKEGKGVPEYEAQENMFIYAIKTYFRHFIELLGLNIFYFILSVLPLILSYFITSQSFWWDVFDSMFAPLTAYTAVQQFAAQAYPRVIFAVLCVFIPLVQFGPIQCGATYVVRNISRRTHTYVWQDFWQHTKSNLKQSFIVMIINILATQILGFAIFYWSSKYAPIQGLYANIVTGFLVIVFVLFLSMSQYIYSLMVNYDMKIKDLYIASYKLAVTRLWMHLIFIIVLLAVLTFLLSIHVIAFVAAIMLVLPVTILFANIYLVESAVRKYAEIKDQ